MSLTSPAAGLIPTKRSNSHSPILNQHRHARHINLRLALQTEQVRTLDHALDLPAIHLHLSQFIQVRVRDVEALAAGVLDEVGPDLPAGRRGEVSVREVEVDAGLEGGVDCGGPVRG